MRAIETTATVSEDGTLTVQVPPDIAPGAHHVIVIIEQAQPDQPMRPPLDFPIHDSGPWPDSLSLRRDDLYGDSGVVDDQLSAAASEHTVFPVIHVVAWPDDLSLRREDLYDDRGR